MESKRVAIYCRVSTTAEVQDGSFETQRDAYIQMIDSRDDLVLAGVYGDHGRSGTSIRQRPEFQRMIHDCEAGKIDVVMTKSISRFARNLRDCLSTIEHLKRLGIPVIFEKEGINTLDNKSDLLLNILAIIAEEESVSIGQNMRWSYERRNAAGDPFQKAPYGYRRDKKANRWYIHESEARRVRYAFQAAGRGACYQELLAGLNEMEREEETGLVWDHNRLSTLLRHEAYIGDVLTNKTYRPSRNRQVANRGERDQYYIEAHHEPIVDRETYDRVQALVKRKLLWTGRKTFTPEDREMLESARRGGAQGQEQGKE